MFKNVAAKFIVFAFDYTTGAAKTGDAANITAYVSEDYGAVTVLADTSATEMDATNAPGYYLFDAAQGETNADVLMISAKSATANVSVIGAPAVIYTRPTTGWLAPTTAGRTLDVSAGGEAGLDWANVGSPTTAQALTGTTIAVTQKVDIDTIKTNPVVNAGTITFPTGATLASTTNITAGTVTTATNVTTVNGLAANVITAAATAADFSTEVNTAVLAVLGALNDAAADGAVTTTDTMVAYLKQLINTLEGAPGMPAWPAAAAPANGVSIAEALRYLYDQVGVAGAGLTAADDAVIAAVAAVQTDTNDMQTRLPATLTTEGYMRSTALLIGDDAIVDNSIAASAIAEIQSGLSTLTQANVRTAVGLASANLDTQLGDLPTNAELATALGTADDAVLAQVALVKAKTDLIPGTIDGYTFAQGWTLTMSALFGKASGLATTTAVYRAVDDTKDRITATVDADGNRTALTLDAA